MAVESRRLARVDEEQDFVVAPCFPHLLERVGQVPAADLLKVLEFEEFVAAVAGHVGQDVALLVRQKAFRCGNVCCVSPLIE